MSTGGLAATRPAAPVLLVLADSLAFHGPQRAEPVSDPRLWPNVAAVALGGTAEVLAGYGWTARHAWRGLTHDPRVWAVLPRVDALVLGVGSMDTLPTPVPTALRELIPSLRPDRLRRAVRRGYLAAQPRLARALRWTPGGRPVALPPPLSVRYLERCRKAVCTIRPGIPVVGVLPGVHRAAAYGYVHAGRAAAEVAIRDWGSASDVALVDLAAVTGEHVHTGRGNPDGLHWGWEAHAAVGTAVAAALTDRWGVAH